MSNSHPQPQNSRSKNSRKRERERESPCPPPNPTHNPSLLSPLHCKICLQIFCDPYTTCCGHTFCRNCITQSVQYRAQCPVCESRLELKRPRTLCPNHTVASLVEKQGKGKGTAGLADQSLTAEGGEGKLAEEQVISWIQNSNLSPDSLQHFLETLKKRQLEVELRDKQLRDFLLNEFLEKMIERRENLAKHVQAELDLLRQDKQKLQNSLGHLSSSSWQRLVPDANSSVRSSESITVEPELATASRANSPAEQLGLFERLGRYRRRLNRHISSLDSAYFGGIVQKMTVQEPNSSVGSVGKIELDQFSDILGKMYQYGDVKLLARLNYNMETTNSLSIVSSIEFDKDGDLFCLAGVTKKIKLFNYEAVVNFDGELHYPCEQLTCSSKISNVSWNPYNKSMLASSDYDGTVQLWDTESAKSTRIYREHEKRCWTVQFNNVDPHLMASGSDDGRVKLWSVTSPYSVGTIDVRANVCCVYFSPKDRNQLVFGSSDHCVHLYDIRQPNKALNIFRGHKKPVSYVKYCNENEVVTASTDSNLRLWEVSSGKCLQTMRGHQNEKNFVGLATDGNFVACGSENNRLFLYCKMVPSPLLSFDFSQLTVDCPAQSLSNSNECTLPEPAANQLGSTIDFVSALCWKKNSDIILAANSQGHAFVLQLQ